MNRKSIAAKSNPSKPLRPFATVALQQLANGAATQNESSPAVWPVLPPLESRNGMAESTSKTEQPVKLAGRPAAHIKLTFKPTDEQRYDNSRAQN
jgi:hypothetical protein